MGVTPLTALFTDGIVTTDSEVKRKFSLEHSKTSETERTTNRFQAVFRHTLLSKQSGTMLCAPHRCDDSPKQVKGFVFQHQAAVATQVEFLQRRRDRIRQQDLS